MGSFSKTRSLPSLPPVLVSEPLTAPLVTVFLPLFSVMVCGMGFKTWVSGTLYSDTTTVEPGRRPVTVTVPSCPVVYLPIKLPFPSFTEKVVLGIGFPVTESTFDSVSEQRGSL